MASIESLKAFEDKLPSVEELKKFNLITRSSAEDKNCRYFYPVHIGYDVVWACAVLPNTPLYAFYDCGTNALTVLRKTGNNPWELVPLTVVRNMYGMFWQILTNLHRFQAHDLQSFTSFVLDDFCGHKINK